MNLCGIVSVVNSILFSHICTNTAAVPTGNSCVQALVTCVILDCCHHVPCVVQGVGVGLISHVRMCRHVSGALALTSLPVEQFCVLNISAVRRLLVLLVCVWMLLL